MLMQYIVTEMSTVETEAYKILRDVLCKGYVCSMDTQLCADGKTLYKITVYKVMGDKSGGINMSHYASYGDKGDKVEFSLPKDDGCYIIVSVDGNIYSGHGKSYRAAMWEVECKLK